MFTRSKLLPAICACTISLIVGATPASASVEKLGFAPSGEVTMRSAAVSFTAGEITVRCRVTLEGEVQEAIAPTSGERLGSVARATASSCEGGLRPSVTFESLPWSMTYSSFSGTQPEAMTGVLATIRGVSVRISASGLACLYSGEVGVRFSLSGEDPYVDGTISTLANSLALVSGALCPRTASMSGTFEFASGEDMVEYRSLALIAEPRYLTRSQALSGAFVTFRPVTHSVTPTIGLWHIAMSGWSTEIEPCIRLISYPSGSCRLLVNATTTAVDNILYLLEGTTLVGLLPVIGR